MIERVAPFLVLFCLGAMWGITMPLTKIAVSDGYQALGLVFWQLTISVVLVGLGARLAGHALGIQSRHIVLCLVVALIGTLIPNAASMTAAVHLPAGVMSILIATVPMFAFPVALAFGIDRFSFQRFAGIACGLAGVALLLGPGAALPGVALAGFVLLALIAPFSYGFEANYIALKGDGGLSPFGLLFGASLVGMVLCFPLAMATGQFIVPPWPFTAPDWALIGSTVAHIFAYAGYFWMIRRYGAVFASQVAYLVTFTGVGWSMLILSERYTGPVWAALALMTLGLLLVQPRGARQSDAKVTS